MGASCCPLALLAPLTLPSPGLSRLTAAGVPLGPLAEESLTVWGRNVVHLDRTCHLLHPSGSDRSQRVSPYELYSEQRVSCGSCTPMHALPPSLLERIELSHQLASIVSSLEYTPQGSRPVAAGRLLASLEDLSLLDLSAFSDLEAFREAVSASTRGRIASLVHRSERVLALQAGAALLLHGPYHLSASDEIFLSSLLQFGTMAPSLPSRLSDSLVLPCRALFPALRQAKQLGSGPGWSLVPVASSISEISVPSLLRAAAAVYPALLHVKERRLLHLPTPVALALESLGYPGVPVDACSPQVLETALVLWDPVGEGPFSSFAAALSAASALS